MGTVPNRLVVYLGIILCLLTLECLAGSKVRTRASASTLAARTGAAIYEESRELAAASSRRVRKRLAIDPDIDEVDLESYQGVLGRPGVDFPVLTGIPKTNFECAQYGNGYFADLETECQVFHICDDGRKISFLCPNGTIFRQLDLICDWWFKVDCASSPSQYAESAETLLRDQKRRFEARKQLDQDFNVESVSTEGFKQQIAERRSGKAIQSRMDTFYTGSPEKRGDSIESFEFVDVPRKHTQSTAKIHYTAKLRATPKRKFESSSSSKEFQEVAETASFVKPRALLNGYTYQVPEQQRGNGYTYPKPAVKPEKVVEPTDRTGKILESSKPAGFGYEPSKSNLYEPKPFNTRPTELISTTPAPSVATTQTTTTTTTSAPTTTTQVPTTLSPQRGSTNFFKSLEQEKERIAKFYNGPPTTGRPPTTYSPLNTYSTAKKLPQKTKESTYYTPTVPTVLTRATTEPSKINQHALEMMKTLQQLDAAPETYSGSRSGLEVPPSSGPAAIHSLALYFATTTLDNSTEPITDEPTTEAGITESNTPAITSALLSEKTVNQYEALFQSENKPDKKLNNRFSDTNDLEAENSRNPIYAAAGSPQIRELAQVFTHALSAYLQDPETFRKILSEIRPTEPPPLIESNEVENRFNNQDVFHGSEASYVVPKTATTSTTTSAPPTATEDLEVLDFSDVTISTRKSPATTTLAPTTTTDEPRVSVPVPRGNILPPISSNSISDPDPADSFRGAKSLEDTTTDANPLAIEINGGLAISTTFPYEGDDDRTTVAPTTLPPTVASDLEPPFKETTKVVPPSKYYEAPPEDEEALQRSHSQTIVGSAVNQLKEQDKKSKSLLLTTTALPDTTTTASTHRGHFITRKITVLDESSTTLPQTTIPDVGRVSNSKTTVAYSVFLDPLTINDGLLESLEQNDGPTPSAFTYLPKDATTEQPQDTTTLVPATNSTATRQGKALSSTPVPRLSTDESQEEFVEAMQRKANEMFGKLNETQADHLMNVMKKADRNKNVRRLILLLIQTCDDDYNKTVEESRNALLNALIQMDSRETELNDVQIVRTNRLGKSIDLSTATPIVTTYRSPYHSRFTSAEHTADFSSVTAADLTTVPTTTTTYETPETTLAPTEAPETTTLPPSTTVTTTTTTTESPTTTTTSPTTTTTTTETPRPSPRTRTGRTRGNVRFQKSLGVAEDFVAESSSHYHPESHVKHSDARALELLRSLYSLASRWG